MRCIGIDPGRSGAIAVIGLETGEFVDQIRLSAEPPAIARFVRRYSKRLGICVLEKVWSRPGNSARSMFTFGENFGFVEGVLARSWIEYELATPQKWMKALDCETGGDKNVTKEFAKTLWPRKKIYHWNADALLIAEYGRRKIKGAL